MSEVEGNGNGDVPGPGPTKKRKLRPLPGLSIEELRHPNDARATDALKKVPGLDTVIKKVLEYGLERLYYVDNVASNLRVTPKMFGRLHRSLTWACKILEVPEPELYVTVDPVPNAFTFGHTKPFVTLTSGLVDMMTDEELFYVIGHEVGHIKAGHVLYGTMARNIAAIVALLGQMTLGLGAILGQGLIIALYEWYRCAELTADRAALLCVQDIEPARSTLMKLAGGTTRLSAEMDRDEFLRQVREYEDVDRSTLDKAYKILLTLYRTHPFAMQRAKELDVWHIEGYEELMARRASRSL
ncbi:MAG TPA: M48 family metallopeptidase [Kofleriaceae bacterium]|nr:M48 family metallopeptidase [Kofleriaceae bacterium]